MGRGATSLRPQLHKTPGNIITTKIQDNKHQRIKEFLSVSLEVIFLNFFLFVGAQQEKEETKFHLKSFRFL